MHKFSKASYFFPLRCFVCRMRIVARWSGSVHLCKLVYATHFPRSAGSNIYGLIHRGLFSQFSIWKVRPFRPCLYLVQ